MRDLDQGFWRFCSSYNDPQPVLPPSRDPVTNRFHSLNQFPYTQISPNKWVMVGMADPTALYNMNIEALRRPWQSGQFGGRPSNRRGFLYNVQIICRDRRIFDYKRLLQDTEPIHGNLVHICLDSSKTAVRVTIPAVLGARDTNKTIQNILEWTPNALRRGNESHDLTEEVQSLADEWPEYVLGPNNPLCFLGPDMKCSFFAA
jgi:hypothetical protein